MKRHAFLMAVLLCAATLLPAGAQGVEPDKKDRKVTLEVIGQIIHVSGRAISVEFSRTKTSAEEILIPITSKTVLKSPLRGVTELQRGDTVKVRYVKVVRDNSEGEAVALTSEATEIARIKEAPKGVLTSNEGGAK